jgi:hypothetical protein
MATKNNLVLVPLEKIQASILEMRGLKVMLDFNLAELYGVATKLLIRAVRRNIDRFPGDFLFQLSDQEVAALRIQNGSSKKGSGGRRYNPYAFTEHGVLMLSSVLESKRAVHVNIEIMRAFVRMREFALSYKELAGELSALEQRYDAQFKVVFNSIRELMRPPDSRKQKSIGFGRS